MLYEDSNAATNCLKNQSETIKPRCFDVDSASFRLRRSKIKWRFRFKILCVIVFILFVCLCIITYFYLKERFVKKVSSNDEGYKTPRPLEICYTDECILSASQMIQKMNRDIDPCDDFYDYSCGGYIDTREVHPDYPHRSLVTEMEENLAVLLKRSLETPSNMSSTSSIYKAKTMYKSCLNQDNEDLLMDTFVSLFKNLKVGVWPFLEDYDGYESIDIEFAIANLLLYQVQPIFMVLTSRSEFDNGTSKLTINFFEGLPDLIEEVYMNETSFHYTQIRIMYKKLMRESLIRVKSKSGPVTRESLRKVLEHIDAFEAAQVMLLQVTYQYADESNETNIMEMSFEEFIQNFPQLNWVKILDYIEETLNIEKFPRNKIYIKVWNLNYMNGMMRLIEDAGPTVLSDYIMWRFLLKFMPFLTNELYDMYKEFIEKVGMEQTNPIQLHLSTRRWKFCIDIVSRNLPIVMTTSYTKTHFSFNQTSNQVREMLPKFEAAFSEKIKLASWLSKESKYRIIQKVNRTSWKLASPDIVLFEEEVDYLHRELALNSSTLIENLLEIIAYQSGEDFLMTENNFMRTSGSNPLVVNAFHATELNAIAIPMGVMSPPLLNRNRPKYLDFAGLGTLIGHEFMHGFNHMGIRYDHSSSLNGSLTYKDHETFKQHLRCFVDQYTEYIYDGKAIDGNYTLGENVCDSEGLELSLKAYRYFVKGEGKDMLLPGLNLTVDQLFFLQHAQIWCEVLSVRSYRLYSKDSHSPGKYRVIGAMRNSKSFSEAFKCSKNSKMNPKKKCSVWM